MNLYGSLFFMMHMQLTSFYFKLFFYFLKKYILLNLSIFRKLLFYTYLEFSLYAKEGLKNQGGGHIHTIA